MPARPATRIGLDLQHLVDFVGDVGQAALGALDALLGARGLLAGRAERLERGAHGAVAGAERALGRGQAVGGVAAGRLPRSATSAISARRFSAKIAGASASEARSCLASALRVSSVAICAAARSRAVAPRLPVGADGDEAAVGQLGLARQRLRLGAHLGELRALAVDLGADGGELVLQVGDGGSAASAVFGDADGRLALRRGRR